MTAIRGAATSWSFCNVCLAEMETFVLPTFGTGSVSPPQGRPPVHRARTRARDGRVTAEWRKLGHEGATTRRFPSKTIEDTILTINEKPTSVEPPSQDELRLRMARVLQSPKSRRMTTAVRQVAMVWFQGATQEEIAKKLKIDQSKASRRLDQTKTWLYRVF